MNLVLLWNIDQTTADLCNIMAVSGTNPWANSRLVPQIDMTACIKTVYTSALREYLSTEVCILLQLKTVE
jgi:hypothetical protein